METAATTELSLNLQVQEQDLRQSGVNKEWKQSQRSSQICANAREEKKKNQNTLLCSVWRYFQDTASKEVEQLLHRQPLHKETEI